MPSPYMQEIKANRRAGLRRSVKYIRAAREEGDEREMANLCYIFSVTWPCVTA